MLSNGGQVQPYAAVERALATPMLVLSLLIIPVLLVPLAWPSMRTGRRELLTGRCWQTRQIDVLCHVELRVR